MRVLLLLPSVLLFAAACGGGSTESTGGGSTTSQPAATGTTAAAATKASGSGAGTGASGGSTSGGAASSGQLDACKLVPVADIARITGMAGVAEILGAPGDPAFCMYGTPAGVQAASLTLTRANAANDFAALASAGTENVPGLGEKAHWQASTKTLTILKGGTMLQIGAAGGLSDTDVPVARRLDMSKQLGAIAVTKQ